MLTAHSRCEVTAGPSWRLWRSSKRIPSCSSPKHARLRRHPSTTYGCSNNVNEATKSALTETQGQLTTDVSVPASASVGGGLAKFEAHARSQHSLDLAQLASRVASAIHVETCSGDDPFAKVKGLTSEMSRKSLAETKGGDVHIRENF